MKSHSGETTIKVWFRPRLQSFAIISITKSNLNNDYCRFCELSVVNIDPLYLAFFSYFSQKKYVREISFHIFNLKVDASFKTLFRPIVQGRTKWKNCRLTPKSPDYQLTLFPWIVSAETILFSIWLNVLWPGNYLVAETICGNTVVGPFWLSAGSYTHKHNFHFMQGKFSQPRLLYNIGK